MTMMNWFLSRGRRSLPYALALAALVLYAPPPVRAQSGGVQVSFKTPEAAVKALIAAVQTGKDDTVLEIIGPEMKGVFATGNALLDQSERAAFLAGAKKKVRIAPDEAEPARRIALIGSSEWPFPAPLVKQGDSWRFDGVAGKQEVQDRRIGFNELNAIDACRGYVDAQLEYASADRTGEGVLQFAQKLISSEGKKDGLYWNNANGEDASPLGLFFTDPAPDGIAPAVILSVSRPGSYSGYRFKILTSQGKNAVGGAKEFLKDGKLFGGFALVAYPAEYGKVGYSTFIVNQLGVVYEKDLGADTGKTAEAMTAFDPDSSWKVVPYDEEIAL